MTDAGRSPSFEQVLAARRMCRDYLERPIDPDVLDAVLRAAFRGPSAGNTAALDLVVLSGAQVDRYWSITLHPERRSSFPWPGLLHAPVLVVPYVSPDAYVERYGRTDKAHTGLGEGADEWSVPYWWVDGGSAVMAILLAAEAAGLGALFFGQFEHEHAVAREWGVPPGRRCLGTVALGHPSGRDRRSASARVGRPDPATHVHAGGWTTPGSSGSEPTAR